MNPFPEILDLPLKNEIGLSETKLFHFHGVFKKNKIKSAKRTPHTFIYMNIFPQILDSPLEANPPPPTPLYI